jgi:Gpi18-like mannosyltransferase
VNAVPLDRGPLTPAPSAGQWRHTGGHVLALVGLFVVAFAIRAFFVADPALGHASDLSFFIDWSRGLATHGLRGFFDRENFCDYPPLMLLVFKAVGGLTPVFGGALASDDDLQRAVKIPACLADALIAVLLYIEARKRIGRNAGLPAAALYLLNPVSIYNSAYWGQVDSIYAALLLASLILVGRTRWISAGVFAAAALGAKFQAIAILPILIFEAYRLGGWRAIGLKLLGAAVGALLILTPFMLQDVSGEALRRSYVNVIGQYHELSKSAYNLWYLTPSHALADTAPPEVVVRVASHGAVQVNVHSSPLLSLRWRTVSLAIFSLAVAVVLSVYSLRPGPIARFGAAGMLAFAFYLFPTEMHERYAFPAIALLPLWAIADRWNERLFFLLSVGLLLNTAARLDIEPAAKIISGAHLALFAALLATMLLPRARMPETPVVEQPEAVAGPRRLIPILRWATALAVIAAVGGAAYLWQLTAAAPSLATNADEVYLSDRIAVSARQGWKTLARDRSVAGGFIQLGETIYLRGLGTHAPARIVYDIPEGFAAFEAIAGIDASADQKGSVRIIVELDGRKVLETPELTGATPPLPIAVLLHDARKLTLICDPTRDGQKSDHVSFALARLTRAAAASQPTTRASE